ncbi:MAG: dienelactone hydrolase family protein [Acidobacteria bacterium]|nr:dienelactone hydrolase family protein [Acidobacteriota bacterium]
MSKMMVITLLTLLSAVSSSAQTQIKQRLERSSRHQEWVDVSAGSRKVNCFLVYPEVEGKTQAVVVIHENRGMTDWVRGVADQLAAAGYIAIVPDMLSGMGPHGGGTSDFPDQSAVTQAINRLSPAQITADLNAVVDYAAGLPAANGKVGVAGFCWGGTETFRFVTNRASLVAGFVFYGTGPTDRTAIERIKSPVYGFYGGSDARVTSTVPATAQMMKEAGKMFEPVTYEGAGHAFMRLGEDPANTSAANKKARDEAWSRWVVLLKHL